MPYVRKPSHLQTRTAALLISAWMMQENQSPFSKIAYKNLGQNPAVRRRLQNELSQATILGESQQKIIKRIRAVTGQAQWQARRVAQTERTRVQSQARWMTGQEAAEKGVNVVNRWSTRMVNSRDTHIALNGKWAKQGERFPGSILRFPGDPEAPASEVINCHCRLSPHVLLEGESIDENGDFVAERNLQNSGERGKINYDKAVFSGQRTLLDHWEKHKAEFTEIKTKEAYLETARWLLRQPLKKGVLEEIHRSDGSIERYYFPKNYLVGTTEDGNLRTFFCPKNKEEYWQDEHVRNEGGEN